MEKQDILGLLCTLLPAQFDVVVVKLRMPPAFIPGPQAPLATRASDVLSWAEQQGRLADVARAYQEVTERASAPATAATTIPAALPVPVRLSTSRRDLAIIVALGEEFRELFSLIPASEPHQDPNLGQRSYLFDRSSYRCVTTFVGAMGEADALRVTERMLDLWQPAVVVVVGIAAGVHDDLRVGDVYVPPQAVSYLQDAKAVADEAGGFVFAPGPPAYRADYALHDAVRHFEFAHAAFGRWREACRADLPILLPDAAARERLVVGDLVRLDPVLLADGHIATGPVVGAAASFSAWIRTHDRNVKALEMESAAVLLSAQTRANPKRALAIRGISDYGDQRKKALDEIGAGALRRYAMRNAVRLLWALLDAGALPRSA